MVGPRIRETDQSRTKRIARQTDKLVRETILSAQIDTSLLRALLDLSVTQEHYFDIVYYLVGAISLDEKRFHRRVRDRAATMMAYLREAFAKAEREAPNQI